jgi:hypothetical protein
MLDECDNKSFFKVTMSDMLVIKKSFKNSWVRIGYLSCLIHFVLNFIVTIELWDSNSGLDILPIPRYWLYIILSVSSLFKIIFICVMCFYFRFLFFSLHFVSIVLEMTSLLYIALTREAISFLPNIALTSLNYLFFGLGILFLPPGVVFGGRRVLFAISVSSIISGLISGSYRAYFENPFINITSAFNLFLSLIFIYLFLNIRFWNVLEDIKMERNSS